MVRSNFVLYCHPEEDLVRHQRMIYLNPSALVALVAVDNLAEVLAEMVLDPNWLGAMTEVELPNCALYCQPEMELVKH